MLITDDFTWDYPTFEAYVEGVRRQVADYPSQRVPFLAPLEPLSVVTLFAIWKEGKIATPLSPRIPYQGQLFTPTMPQPYAASPPEWDLGAVATAIYTSGSTAKPKLACQTFKNHVMSAKGSLLKVPLTPESCWALTLPLFHVGGLAILFRCYLAKASVLLSKNFSRATHLSLVPTQLYRLLKEEVSLPSLETILLGGAPLPSFETPWNVLPTYGMTEMSSQIVTDHTLHPHAEMKISESREIWVRGGTLFQGYLQEDRTTLLPLNTEGWFETNDLGEWKEGKFRIIGRKDNQFSSGGENIQPEEIEAAIRESCGILDAIVVPIADEEFGHRPAIFLSDLAQFPLIQTKLLGVLPKFKIPVQPFPLPGSAGLKPNRKALLDFIPQF